MYDDETVPLPAGIEPEYDDEIRAPCGGDCEACETRTPGCPLIESMIEKRERER